ncbi:helix-turn-helix transcriptional regulator [Allokutzneria albata]|uniref:Predicted DNA-binding transcriptional regulator YafY, contains an HTH and WYL domains n=1 Tax=Allokutzneria albata TaxID=211114 RepID=A0A1G9TCK0_ALLAB|nr:YafY family protein [Allokutzneria albata]SDM45358.1 Predicted DNA-binding transcriptional regulator YafY, contains an HTH and WYL domains [Allokutzneria albata]
MGDTPGRLLSLLSLLQTPREWPGSELAERLEVSLRTIRRDIDRLRSLGYPVEATMGSVGGYRLVAGTALPPLLLDDDEAVAIAVGLRTAAGHAVAGIEESSVRALAKLEQVLPSRLRYRVGALNSATVPVLSTPGPLVEPGVLTVLAAAIANHERVRFAYSAADDTESKRHIEPHSLVPSGRRWYLVAFDLDRDDWRMFRVDRIAEPLATGARATQRTLPASDAAEFLTSKMYSLAPTYSAVATVHMPLRELSARFGGNADQFEEISPTTCRVRSDADTIEWLALRLAVLGCEFEVHDPPELVEHLRGLGERITRAASVR